MGHIAFCSLYSSRGAFFQKVNKHQESNLIVKPLRS